VRRVLTTSLAVVLLLSPLLLVLGLRVRHRFRPAPRENDVALARDALLSGKVTTAETRLRRHLRRDPADARAWQLLAESLRAQGRSDEGESASRRAADLAPGWDAPAVALAAAALARDRDEPAGELLEHAITAGGTTRSLLRARSVLHARAGRFAAAAEDLERAATKKDGGAADLLDAARHARTAAFVAGIDDERSRDLLGHALRIANDDETAASIRRELDAPGDSENAPAAQVIEARRAAAARLDGLARAHLREALLARPDDPDIAFALGMRLGLANDLGVAVSIADRLPGRGAGPAGRRLLGWFQVGCGDTDRADGLLLGRRRDPAQARRLERVLEAARTDGPDVARDRACGSVDADPSDALPRLVLGMAAEHDGDVHEAIRHYTAALARDPSLVIAANDLAWHLRTSPDALPAARRLAAWARHLAPTNARVAHTESAVCASDSSSPDDHSERNDR
jgi:tetratricopeptide (TPR) repeat protein